MPDAKKFAITWIELLLLIVTVAAGMGTWIVAKQVVEIREKTNEPLELNYQKDANVLDVQAKLSAAQSEVAALQARLTQERVEQIKKQHLVDTLTEAQKTDKPPAPADLEKARADFESTNDFISRLSTALDNKLTASNTAQIELETAKRRAASDLARAQIKFLWHKRWVTVKYFGIAVGVLLFLILAVVLEISRAGGFEVNLTIVFGGAAALLGILVGYELFALAGAALIGVLIVIIVLAHMPTKEKDPAT